MDIDLGEGMNGPDAAKKILQIKYLPIVFLTSYSESEMVNKVKSITRYGYVIKDSGLFVLLSSIEMAFDLFEAHQNIELKVKELDEKEKTFKKIFHTNSVLMALTSLHDGKFIEVNETFLNKLGYTRDEVIGKTAEFVTDSECITEAISLLKSFGTLKHFENRVYTKTGDTLYGLCSVDFIEMNGKKCMLSSMVDITESKVAREAAEKSEAYYNLLADHMSDVVWLMDLNLNIFYCSPSIVKVRGYSMDEITNMPLENHLTHDSVLKVKSIYNDEKEKFMNDRNYSFVLSMEAEYIRKDGTTFWADNILTLIRDKDGNPESILGEGRDITERKLSDEKIKKLLAEKELLLKEVHHRVKNNMNTIASLLYLQSNSLDSETAVNALKEAQNRVQSMMLIYDKLYRSENFMEISSKEYLTDLVKKIKRTISTSSKIEIVMDLEDLLIDSSTLFPVGIILNELMANAFKYAFPEGTDGMISISFLNKDDNDYEIIFKDNGRGIPDSVISGDSTGFGINLIKILVSQIKGRLDIHRDNGTEYIIKFSHRKKTV